MKLPNGGKQRSLLAKISFPGCKLSFPDAKPRCSGGAGNYENNTTLKTSIFSSFNIVQARTSRSKLSGIPGISNKTSFGTVE